MQKVVRTFPPRFRSESRELANLLNDGYSVIMCNEIKHSSGETICLEYIVEKKEEPHD